MHRRHTGIASAILGFGLGLGPAASPAAALDIQFVNVSTLRGIGSYSQTYGHGGGIAAADYDDDGDIDMFIPNAYGHGDQLYRNNGDGTYTEIAASLGLNSTEAGRAALWFDYDGDGLLDLLVAKDHHLEFVHPSPSSTLRLYRQHADGTFTDVTEAAGLLGVRHEHHFATQIGGLCAGDVTNDGHLDLFVSQWYGELYLFVNNGDGTFIDVSVASGISNGPGDPLVTAFQPIMHDFNDDGWLDIFLAVDFAENILWINQQDGTFLDIAAQAGTNHTWNGMGVAPGDYDNDGDIDLYVTNIFEPDNKGVQKHNLLYRNDTVGGVVQFTDVAEAVGVDNGYWGWGASFVDIDRDGLLDLAEVNGFETYPFLIHPPRLFHNLGGTFVDVAEATGFYSPEYATCVVAFDSDRDGDLDLVRTTIDSSDRHLVKLTECHPAGRAKRRGDGHFYLTVRPRMEGLNCRAIGAIVRIEVGGVTMTRLLTAGTSYLGQEPAEAHFGVGTNVVIDSLTIDWPNGGSSTITDVPVNKVHTITRWRCPGDALVNDAVDVFDLIEVLRQWGEPTNPRADVDSSGFVDEQDLLAVLNNWGPCP